MALKFRLPQTCVYFAPAGTDGYGRPAYAFPVQYACRWEEVYTETIDGEGNAVVSSATVYLANDINVTGALFKGTLAEVESSSWLPDVKQNPGVHEIYNKQNTPSLKGDQNLICVHLK